MGDIIENFVYIAAVNLSLTEFKFEGEGDTYALELVAHALVRHVAKSFYHPKYYYHMILSCHYLCLLYLPF